MKNRISVKSILAIAGICTAYLILSTLLIGFKTNQVVLICLFCIMYFLSGPTRRFILGFSIFIVYWIIFDYMKLLPNYEVNPVHIKDLYDHEKNLFGISYAGSLLTPHELLERFHQPLLDVASGFFYLCWVPVPMLLAGYFFFKKPEEFLRFSLSFLWINLIGFVIYYIYPAAPPWYIEQYGTAFNAATPGNTAGLARFDAFFNIELFHNMYAQSSNVFAAMPSLHSAYPLLVFYYGVKNKLGWINIIFGIIMAGIWLSAIYTGHHYLMDVIAGIITCIIGIITFNKIAASAPVNGWLEKYRKTISKPAP